MIYLYSGTPGSGKSLHQAIDIYYHLKYKRPVIANFDVNTSKFKNPLFKYIDNLHLKPELLVEISQEYFKTHNFKEGAIKLYIDECQILFNSREWNKDGRKEWLVFFTQHRKYGYDIFLVAQFDRMIDRQIRSLIEYEVIHRKVKNFGKFGWLLNLICGGNLFVSVTMWYPMRTKERTNWEFYKGKKKYFEIYNTYKTFNKSIEQNSDKLPEDSSGSTPSVSAGGLENDFSSYQQKYVDNSI